MTGWVRKIGAWMAAMALAVPGAQPALAQNPDRLQGDRQEEGRFRLRHRAASC
jgi:hypothetical protein